jgi:hypothetical protein
MPFPINIENLLVGRSVESERIEFKEGWKYGIGSDRKGYRKMDILMITNIRF